MASIPTDGTLDLSAPPARPASGFVIANARLRA